jgi:uncharacterized protein YecT (DUF1311 family)
MERTSVLRLVVVAVAAAGFAAAITAFTLSREPASGRCPFVPDAWMPSLTQARENLADSIAAQTNRSQQALNRAGQDMADLADAQLFIAYVLLVKQLEEKDAKAFFTEQVAWLSARKESARHAIVSKGGSLEALEYSNAFRAVTEKRLAELETRLSRQPAKPAVSLDERKK